LKIYVLDACAVLAALSNEEGADKVEVAYDEASSSNAKILSVYVYNHQLIFLQYLFRKLVLI